jgi:DNA-binding HxlR family transcriptional regulator
MSSTRRYLLLCPIARSLDAVGDRWSLLILRDLHAGPARFGELETGLGIATNLLTTRLRDLIGNGMVTKMRIEGKTHYALTDVGRGTDRILWELARFGLLLDPEPEPRPPGNLRSVVLPLRFALEAVDDRPTLAVRMKVDRQPFSIRTSNDAVAVDYGDTFGDANPDIELAVGYEPLLALLERRVAPDDFATEHVSVTTGSDRLPEFRAMLLEGFELVD